MYAKVQTAVQHAYCAIPIYTLKRGQIFLLFKLLNYLLSISDFPG